MFLDKNRTFFKFTNLGYINKIQDKLNWFAVFMECKNRNSVVKWNKIRHVHFHSQGGAKERDGSL